MPKRWCAGVFLTLFILGGIALAWRKAPWFDEGAFGCAAYHFARDGRLMVPNIEPAADDPKMTRSDEHVYWTMPLHMVWVGTAAKVFGFTLFKIRLYTLFWGAVALLAWASVAGMLTANRTLATLALALLAVDTTFLIKSADMRPDAMTAALGALALASYLRLREGHFTLALLVSQSLVVLSGLTHPNGGLLAFLDSAILLLYFDRRRLRWRDALPFAAPYLAGAVGFGLYVAQDFALARVQFGGNATGRLSGFFAPWTALQREIATHYWDAFAGAAAGARRLKLLVLACYCAGAAGALSLVRRVKGAGVLVLLAAAHFCYLTFFETTKQGAYLIHMMPPLAILLAVSITALWFHRPAWRIPLAVSVTGLVLLQLAGTAGIVLRGQPQKDYLAAIAFLEQHAKPGDTILGPIELGFDLGFDRRITDDRRLCYYSRKRPQFLVVSPDYRLWFEIFRRERPEIYAHIQSVLSGSTRVLKNEEFEIYVPK